MDIKIKNEDELSVEIDDLVIELKKVKSELTSSVEHANEGWNGKLDVERERDEWKAAHDYHEKEVGKLNSKCKALQNALDGDTIILGKIGGLIKRWRSKGAHYEGACFACADELEETMSDNSKT